MLNKARRRFRWEAVWALGLVCGVPVFAGAQQTGLFPLHPIRRQRVPCPNEDPVYGQYRNQYYGYFPTCWQRFPEGWGCPSAEAPNAAKAFEKLPLQTPPEGGGGAENGREPRGMQEEPLGPPVGRSPAPDRGALPPLPRDESSPFNLDNAPPSGNRPGAPPAATPRSGGPQSNAPNRVPPPALAILPAPSEAPPPDGAGEPLLTLPEPSEPPPPVGSPTADPASVPLPAPEGFVPPVESAPPASTSGVNAPAASADPPAQAPRRKTLIGGLLGSLGLKRQ